MSRCPVSVRPWVQEPPRPAVNLSVGIVRADAGGEVRCLVGAVVKGIGQRGGLDLQVGHGLRGVVEQDARLEAQPAAAARCHESDTVPEDVMDPAYAARLRGDSEVGPSNRWS